MRLLEHKIWHMPLILLLTLWLGACSSSLVGEDFEPVPEEDSGLSLILGIYTGDPTPGLTRSADIEFESERSDRELMQTLRVIIIESATRKVIHNDYVTLDKPSDYKDGLKYPVAYSTVYKIYLVANEAALSSANQTMLTTIDKNDILSTDYLEGIIIGSDAVGNPMITAAQSDIAVPITEIFEITTVNEEDAVKTEGNVVQKENFFITRAVTKFSFYFFRSDDLDPTDAVFKDLTVDKIKVTGLGSEEYLFPTEETVYSPTKYINGIINSTDLAGKIIRNREITSFELPTTTDATTGEYEFILPTGGIKVKDLRTKPVNFDSSNPTASLPDYALTNYAYSPMIYFPESKGEGSQYVTGGIGTFNCTIKYNEESDYLPTVRFKNLPNGMPRNTHVVVIVTIHPNLIEAAVDVIPFSEVILKDPLFGLERDDFGFIKGKDSQNRDCWYDLNYYEDENGVSNAIPLYLGPDKNNPIQLVSGLGPIVNKDPESGVESITYGPKNYLLVYADGDDYDKPVFEKAYIWGYLKDENGEYKVDEDGNKIWGPMPDYDENGYHKDAPQVNHYEQISGYERRASTLYMIIEEDTKKRYIISPDAITRYKYDTNGGFYLNQLRQRVWLDSTIAIIPPGKTTPDGLFHSHRVYFEWDILEWNYAVWDRLTNHYPKAWFDVFGNRYLWEEGDTKEKRDQVLRNKYGDLVDYLEGNPKNTN